MAPASFLLLPQSLQQDGALTDEMRLSLTGSFLPGVSLLFGALFSYTISLLVSIDRILVSCCLLYFLSIADRMIILYCSVYYFGGLFAGDLPAV